MRTIILFAWLLVVPQLTWGQAAGLPAGQVPESLGVNIHFTAPKPGEMELLAAGGFKWVRMDLHWNQSWSATEKVKGEYDFSKYDRLVAALEPHGIRAIFILDYGNPLYDRGLSPYTDEGRQAYARWAVAAAKHFAGRGILWEVWNEPNGKTFWKPKPNADDYAKLALTVGEAFRKEVPNEVLIGPALAKFDWPFLETCFEAGVLEYFSAVTVHPYRDSGPETVAADYRRLRRLINQYAPAGKTIPIISGEWGYFMKLKPENTPELQGKILARQWLTNLANDIPVSIWYDWRDDGTNPTDREHHLGTVGHKYHENRDPAYDLKPAYGAARALTTALGGSTFSKRLLVGSDEDHVLLFSKDGQPRLAVWTTGEEHDLTIPANVGSFSVTSWAGEQLPAADATGDGLTVRLTNGPKYIVPEAPSDLLSIAAAWESLPVMMPVEGPGEVTITTDLTNPTGATIRAGVNGSDAVAIAPGASHTFSVAVPVLRSPVREPIRLTLRVEGMGSVAQETWLDVTNALEFALKPLGSGKVLATVVNPAGQEATGTLSAATSDRGGESPGPALKFSAGQKEQAVEMTLQQPLPAKGVLRLALRNKSGEVVAASELPYSCDPADAMGDNGYAIWAKNQSLASAEAPEPAPTQYGPVLKVEYNLTGRGQPGPGGGEPITLVAVTPKGQDKAVKIAGKPSSMVMWVYGDNNGLAALARFQDSTGQVFQTNRQAIDWTGWHAMTFPLNDGDVWHWGGANDGVIHYPIKWHTLFLFESVKREEASGVMYLSSPTVLWDRIEDLD